MMSNTHPVQATALEVPFGASPFDTRSLAVIASSQDNSACPGRFAQTFTYAWSVQKDGEDYTLPEGTDTASASFTFTPNDNGGYTVSLKGSWR